MKNNLRCVLLDEKRSILKPLLRFGLKKGANDVDSAEFNHNSRIVLHLRFGGTLIIAGGAGGYFMFFLLYIYIYISRSTASMFVL